VVFPVLAAFQGEDLFPLLAGFLLEFFYQFLLAADFLIQLVNLCLLLVRQGFDVGELGLCVLRLPLGLILCLNRFLSLILGFFRVFLGLILFLVCLAGIILRFVLLALDPALLFFKPLLLFLLLLEDEVVALQMVQPGLRLFPASFHVQCLSNHILHHGHIIGIELEGLSCLVIHPVPDNMCMVIRLPSLFISRVFIVALVFMEEYLDRLDAPPSFHYPGVFEKVIGNSEAK